jgi:hypothetical protein
MNENKLLAFSVDDFKNKADAVNFVFKILATLRFVSSQDVCLLNK